MKHRISVGEKRYEEKHGSVLENGWKCRTTTNSIITEVFTEKKLHGKIFGICVFSNKIGHLVMWTTHQRFDPYIDFEGTFVRKFLETDI